MTMKLGGWIVVIVKKQTLSDFSSSHIQVKIVLCPVVWFMKIHPQNIPNSISTICGFFVLFSNLFRNMFIVIPYRGSGNLKVILLLFTVCCDLSFCWVMLLDKQTIGYNPNLAFWQWEEHAQPCKCNPAGHPLVSKHSFTPQFKP